MLNSDEAYEFMIDLSYNHLHLTKHIGHSAESIKLVPYVWADNFTYPGFKLSFSLY